MRASLRLELPWPPTLNTNTSPNGRGGRILTPGHRAFRKEVWVIWKAQKHPTLVGPLRAELDLTAPTYHRYDIDNRVKPVLDALQRAGAFKDDSQVDTLYVQRVRYDALRAGVWVTLEELT